MGNLFARADRKDRYYGPAGQLLDAAGTRYAYDALGNLRSKTTCLAPILKINAPLASAPSPERMA